MFGSPLSRMCGMPTVFAPVTTSASLVGTSAYCERSAAAVSEASGGQGSSYYNEADVLEHLSEVQALSLGYSAIGDAGLLRLPLARWSQMGANSAILPNLVTADLSFCNLSAAPAVVAILRNVLMNAAAAPRLTTLLLMGNFRSEFGSSSVYCVGNNNPSDGSNREANGGYNAPHPAEAFVSLLVESWKSHPALVILALDPWLVAHHAAYQALKKERASAKHLYTSQKLQQQQQLADQVETASVVSRRRQSVFEPPRKVNMFDELVAAAEGSLVEARPTDTVAEIQYKMVQLQLAEHRGRERITRSEVGDRRALAKETSQFVQATIVAATRAVKNKVQRIVAMEELESEMRHMLVQKESDARRKLLFRIGPLA